MEVSVARLICSGRVWERLRRKLVSAVFNIMFGQSLLYGVLGILLQFPQLCPRRVRSCCRPCYPTLYVVVRGHAILAQGRFPNGKNEQTP